jgi:hypothetical protein
MISSFLSEMDRDRAARTRTSPGSRKTTQPSAAGRQRPPRHFSAEAHGKPDHRERNQRNCAPPLHASDPVEFLNRSGANTEEFRCGGQAGARAAGRIRPVFSG